MSNEENFGTGFELDGDLEKLWWRADLEVEGAINNTCIKRWLNNDERNYETLQKSRREITLIRLYLDQTTQRGFYHIKDENKQCLYMEDFRHARFRDCKKIINPNGDWDWDPKELFSIQDFTDVNGKQDDCYDRLKSKKEKIAFIYNDN